MITKGEINQKAKDLEVHTSNVQRDYVFGWLLAGIYTASGPCGALILKGGNCPRKGYFEHTRFSGDLDFSTQSSIEETFIRDELNRACRFAQERSGVAFETEETRVEAKRQIYKDRLEYEARLYFHDFYGKASIKSLRWHSVVLTTHLAGGRSTMVNLPLSWRQDSATVIATSGKCGCTPCQRLELLPKCGEAPPMPDAHSTV